jgi:hypothetical protein
MRPYLVLTAVVFMAVAAFGQQPFPHPIYGPYVPLLTTPEVSLQQYSPNPVGASNATTGLIAGATNSTLSQIQGSTSSVYSVPVWYQGGDAPLTSSQVHLWPERVGREGRVMREEHAREEHGAREEARAGWTYFSGHEHTASAAQAAGTKGNRQAGHVYTNDDVTRQNDKNGAVKYDGKTEKL